MQSITFNDSMISFLITFDKYTAGAEFNAQLDTI